MKLLSPLLLLLLPGLGVQDPPPAPVPAPVPAPGAPDAAALWKAIQAATRAPGAGEAVTAFQIVADMRVRGDGVERNDLEKAEYSYLAPNLVRFRLGPGRETGRGPGKGDRAYWLKEQGRVTVLTGRENKEERNLVRRMTSIAQNFLALSNPADLRVSDLRLLNERPDELPTSLRVGVAKQLDWLQLASPDFDLYAEGAAPTEPEQLYRVQLGVDRGTKLPRLVTVAELPGPGPDATPATVPLLLDLADYRGVDGTTIPHRILVHALAPGGRYAKLPSQEIYLVKADLTPALEPKDFEPGP